MARAGSRYNGVIDSYTRVARTEGLSQGLYKGLGPNIARNRIMNVCEIVVYDVIKETILTMVKGSKAFYKGFTVSCMRIVSWNIMLWMSYEQLKKGVKTRTKHSSGVTRLSGRDSLSSGQKWILKAT